MMHRTTRRRRLPRAVRRRGLRRQDLTRHRLPPEKEARIKETLLHSPAGLAALASLITSRAPNSPEARAVQALAVVYNQLESAGRKHCAHCGESFPSLPALFQHFAEVHSPRPGDTIH